MRSVTYANSSENPSGADRTISFQVNDGGAVDNLSNIATSTVHVTPVNDHSIVSAGAALSYTENQPATAIDGTVTISDVDSTTLTGATVSIGTGFVAAEDALGFSTQNGITASY